MGIISELPRRATRDLEPEFFSEGLSRFARKQAKTLYGRMADRIRRLGPRDFLDEDQIEVATPAELLTVSIRRKHDKLIAAARRLLEEEVWVEEYYSYPSGRTELVRKTFRTAANLSNKDLPELMFRPAYAYFVAQLLEVDDSLEMELNDRLAGGGSGAYLELLRDLARAITTLLDENPTSATSARSPNRTIGELSGIRYNPNFQQDWKHFGPDLKNTYLQNLFQVLLVLSRAEFRECCVLLLNRDAQDPAVAFLEEELYGKERTRLLTRLRSWFSRGGEREKRKNRSGGGEPEGMQVEDLFILGETDEEAEKYDHV